MTCPLCNEQLEYRDHVINAYHNRLCSSCFALIRTDETNNIIKIIKYRRYFVENGIDIFGDCMYIWHNNILYIKDQEIKLPLEKLKTYLLLS